MPKLTKGQKNFLNFLLGLIMLSLAIPLAKAFVMGGI